MSEETGTSQIREDFNEEETAPEETGRSPKREDFNEDERALLRTYLHHPEVVKTLREGKKSFVSDGTPQTAQAVNDGTAETVDGPAEEGAQRKKNSEHSGKKAGKRKAKGQGKGRGKGQKKWEDGTFPRAAKQVLRLIEEDVGTAQEKDERSEVHDERVWDYARSEDCRWIPRRAEESRNAYITRYKNVGTRVRIWVKNSAEPKQAWLSVPGLHVPKKNRSINGTAMFSHSDDPARPPKKSELRAAMLTGDAAINQQALDAWHVSTWNKACAAAWEKLPEERRTHFNQLAEAAERERQAERERRANENDEDGDEEAEAKERLRRDAFEGLEEYLPMNAKHLNHLTGCISVMLAGGVDANGDIRCFDGSYGANKAGQSFMEFLACRLDRPGEVLQAWFYEWVADAMFIARKDAADEEEASPGEDGRATTPDDPREDETERIPPSPPEPIHVWTPPSPITTPTPWLLQKEPGAARSGAGTGQGDSTNSATGISSNTTGAASQGTTSTGTAGREGERGDAEPGQGAPTRRAGDFDGAGEGEGGVLDAREDFDGAGEGEGGVLDAREDFDGAGPDEDTAADEGTGTGETHGREGDFDGAGGGDGGGPEEENESVVAGASEESGDFSRSATVSKSHKPSRGRAKGIRRGGSNARTDKADKSSAQTVAQDLGTKRKKGHGAAASSSAAEPASKRRRTKSQAPSAGSGTAAVEPLAQDSGTKRKKGPGAAASSSAAEPASKRRRVESQAPSAVSVGAAVEPRRTGRSRVGTHHSRDRLMQKLAGK